MAKSLNLLLLFVVFAHTALGQESFDVEQIIENIRFDIPQFRNAPMDIVELEETAIPELYSGRLVITGGPSYSILIADDLLHIIAVGPIDIGRSADELALLMMAEQQAQMEEARERSVELDRFAAGMPDRGNSEAGVTVYEFSDFQCPYCARGFDMIEELLDKRGEEVRFVYLHLPLEMHDWALPAAIASTCAASQAADAFWVLHDSYFLNQKAITLDNLIERSRAYLSESGINLDRWAVCASDESSAAHRGARGQVEAAMELASKYGITGTPSFFVDGHNLKGIQPLEVFEEMIDRATSQ